MSYLGCYSEPPYDSLFYKAYLDYRHRIDWTKLPDLSHVTQACAQKAIKRNYSYFAIKNYGVCSWGPDGLTITTKGTKGSGCFLTIGGPSAVSVFKISKTKGDKVAALIKTMSYLYVEKRKSSLFIKKNAVEIFAEFKYLHKDISIRG